MLAIGTGDIERHGSYLSMDSAIAEPDTSHELAVVQNVNEVLLDNCELSTLTQTELQTQIATQTHFDNQLKLALANKLTHVELCQSFVELQKHSLGDLNVFSMAFSAKDTLQGSESYTLVLSINDRAIFNGTAIAAPANVYHIKGIIPQRPIPSDIDIAHYRDLIVLKAESDSLAVLSHLPVKTSVQFVDEMVDTFSQGDLQHHDQLLKILDERIYSIKECPISDGFKTILLSDLSVTSDQGNDEGYADLEDNPGNVQWDEIVLIHQNDLIDKSKFVRYQVEVHEETITLYCPIEFSSELVALINTNHLLGTPTLREHLSKLNDKMLANNIQENFTPIAERFNQALGYHDKVPDSFHRLDDISLGKCTLKDLINRH
ncbi:hypothetical protein D5R81_14085 [Parashewanella spongiae]|uniref:Uncharacterized protein n=1 Tax=Parashewanella spongiae TaxID=342950 RepID=A0A3A6U0T6_9GAMM|nr:hypothetical protein [Parashewanella spongiae]MCL1079087.1 hypothetical protein [Parashewanella spongiae]RJY10699.1 hypothetical protein D5R81_14085 [Parashewanella spongiae]